MRGNVIKDANKVVEIKRWKVDVVNNCDGEETEQFGEKNRCSFSICQDGDFNYLAKWR